jgi:release factor glutamine methyltransferase
MISVQTILQQTPLRRDAQILLCHVLECDQSFLYAHPEHELSTTQVKQFNILLKRRQQGEPIAYLLGYRDFWQLRLEITPEVLIPRHETELLVETALVRLPKSHCQVADLGTGSGAIACALAYERPQWQVVATDQSTAALALAQANAKRYKLSIRFYQGNWLNALPPGQQFDAIVSNPPYIAADEPQLQQGDVRFEPDSALVAAQQGLVDINTIATQACHYLKPNGLLILEHGYRQGQSVRTRLQSLGYNAVNTLTDHAGHERVTLGVLPDPMVLE